MGVVTLSTFPAHFPLFEDIVHYHSLSVGMYAVRGG
jgi:hypothetical protein